MKRRDALKYLVAGGTAIAFSGGVALAQYPKGMDSEELFQGINRVKDPSNKTTLEKKHVPVIKAPSKVKAGEAFDVEIMIGEIDHPMGPEHWIEYVQLNIINEPAGTVNFISNGFAKAKARFTVVLGDNYKGKTIPLVIHEKCNLHGIWESYCNVEVI
jgi:superoxide reductase